MADTTKETPKGPVIHKILWFPGTTQEMIDTFPRLLARQNDIFINTYTKAGTTWTQEVVWQIIHSGNIDYRRLDVRMPWLDGMVHPLAYNPYSASSPLMIERLFESFPAPRVFKTHFPYDLVPKPRDKATNPRYIYVMRNPKDTAVSYYHHFEKDPIAPGTSSLNYSSKEKDSPGAIQKIARFIGKELPPEIVERIVKQTSFNAMKKDEKANYSWINGIKGDFIRKGEVGDWKNYFTEEQNKRFDSLYAEKMAGSGLEFEFE